MNEPEWRAAADDLSMLRFLGGRHGPRKMRLFLCGCARWAGDRIPLVQWREAITVGEEYADGECPEGRRSEHGHRMLAVTRPAEQQSVLDELASMGIDFDLARDSEVRAWFFLCVMLLRTDGCMSHIHTFNGWLFPRGHLQAVATALLRDIFGNPFRPVAFDPRWRTEHTVGIASKMYEEREFAAMPILADALEEAGCDYAEVLTHCREPAFTFAVAAWLTACWAKSELTNGTREIPMDPEDYQSLMKEGLSKASQAIVNLGTVVVVTFVVVLLVWACWRFGPQLSGLFGRCFSWVGEAVVSLVESLQFSVRARFVPGRARPPQSQRESSPTRGILLSFARHPAFRLLVAFGSLAVGVVAGIFQCDEGWRTARNRFWCLSPDDVERRMLGRCDDERI